jgi:oligoribonuclease NrnB/cAMP/cGMP phosphodiesterase (DHH superfamily)
MPSAPKIHVFTDCDLDGAASLLAFKWLVKPKHLTYNIVRVNDFRERFLEWQKRHSIKSYEKIFILDLDVSQDSLDIVDHENIVIIDHHDTHVQNKDKYKNATTLIENYTSCAKLLYTKFHKDGDLTPNQQLLILLADDYDSYTLKLKESYELNVLYWNYQGDRFKKLEDDFRNGFFKFNNFQQNIINFHTRKLKRLKDTIEVHTANIPIKNEDRKFVSTFADSCINEIAEHIISKYNADIGMVVNLKTKKVSVRKAEDCDVHVGELCQKLFKGGGHEYAGGGVYADESGVNDTFMQFTKLFESHS